MIGYTQEHLDPLRNPCAMVGKTGMYYLQPALRMQERILARVLTFDIIVSRYIPRLPQVWSTNADASESLP